MSSASSSAAGGGSGATMTSHSAAAAASQGHTTAVTHDTQDSISAPPSPASSQDKTPQNEVKNLKRVMNFWKEFDLPKKQEELNTYVTEFFSQTKQFSDKKKQLAEDISQVKQLTDVHQQVSEWPYVVQKLQQEVDTQVKRARYAEKSFSKMLKDFTSAPDPSDGLKRAVEMKKKMSRLEQELHEAQSDARAYEDELSKLQNQDVTIRDLESRVEELVNHMDEHVHEKVAQREKELQREHETEMRQLQSTCSDLRSRLNEAEKTINDYQRQLEQSESKIFDVRTRNDEDLNSKQKEIEMLTEELENTKAQLSQLQQENEAYREKLGSGVSKNSWDKMQAEITALRSELEKERSSNQKLSSQFSRDREKHQSAVKERDEQIQNLNRKIEDLGQENDKLRSQLNSRPSHEHLRTIESQLDKIKQLCTGYSGQGDKEDKSASELVEEKLQEIRSQLATEHRAKNDLSEELKTKDGEIREWKQEVNDLRALVNKLEQHVEATTVGGNSETQKDSGSKTSSTAEDQLRQAVQEPSSESLKSSHSNETEQNAKEFQTREAALLHVLKDQRERFRKRAEEAESHVEKLRTLSQHDQDYIKKLENECARLKHEASVGSSAVGAGQPHGTGPSATFVRGAGARAARMSAMIFAARDGATSLLPAFSGDYSMSSLLHTPYSSGTGVFGRCRRVFQEMCSSNSASEHGDEESGRGFKMDNLSERTAIFVSRSLHSSQCARNTAFAYILLIHALFLWCILFS